MLAPLQRQLRLRLAIRAFQPQHHFLRRFGFFVEHRFRLTAVARLFAVVAAFTLGEEGGLEGWVSWGVLEREGEWGEGYFAGFVLGYWDGGLVL